jgi:hypothetical protein
MSAFGGKADIVGRCRSTVTGDDGSLDYPHTRARNAYNLFWRHHVSPTVPGRRIWPGTAGPIWRTASVSPVSHDFPSWKR